MLDLTHPISSHYASVINHLLKLKKCVVLTGAGISKSSGIPTFRSKNGMWEKYDPAQYASIEIFRKDPSKYWSLRGEFIRNYNSYKPNLAHTSLTKLEKIGIVRSIITQNVDGLHKKAGSQLVIEIHGTLREILCLKCSKIFIAPNIPEGNVPHCKCGGLLKPKTVLFGEMLPVDELNYAEQEAKTCNTFLSIGTSALVRPASLLPKIAKDNGAILIELNIKKEIHYSDIFVEGKAEVVLPRIVEDITKITG